MITLNPANGMPVDPITGAAIWGREYYSLPKDGQKQALSRALGLTVQQLDDPKTYQAAITKFPPGTKPQRGRPDYEMAEAVVWYNDFKKYGWTPVVEDDRGVVARINGPGWKRMPGGLKQRAYSISRGEGARAFAKHRHHLRQKQMEKLRKVAKIAAVGAVALSIPGVTPALKAAGAKVLGMAKPLVSAGEAIAKPVVSTVTAVAKPVISTATTVAKPVIETGTTIVKAVPPAVTSAVKAAESAVSTVSNAVSVVADKAGPIAQSPIVTQQARQLVENALARQGMNIQTPEAKQIVQQAVEQQQKSGVDWGTVLKIAAPIAGVLLLKG